MSKIHVIHENDAWLAPLRAAFGAIGAPHEEWFLDRGLLDLTQPPPEGVFYNRMSASSHTRGHHFAPEYAAAVVEWLNGAWPRTPSPLQRPLSEGYSRSIRA